MKGKSQPLLGIEDGWLIETLVGRQPFQNRLVASPALLRRQWKAGAALLVVAGKLVAAAFLE